MRKKIMSYLEDNLVAELDQRIIRPCTRADALNDILAYALKNHYIIDVFVKERNDAMKAHA